jgi:hypothetical protein
MAAWGYRISEKLVGTSVVAEASAFHIWRSWKREKFLVNYNQAVNTSDYSASNAMMILNNDIESIWENLRGLGTTSRLPAYDIIYLLTAIGLSPGGSNTVHIYTQTVHRTIRNKQYIEQHNNFGRVRAVPRLG